MPRYTPSYSNFLSRIAEVQALIGIAKLESRKPLSQRNAAVINSAARASVVLLSSHIQGYVEELTDNILESIFIQKVPMNDFGNSFEFYLSQDITRVLRNSPNPDVFVRELKRMLRRDEDIWSDTPYFERAPNSEPFKGNFGNPTFKEIKRYLNRFGYQDYDANLRNYLGNNYLAATNMVDAVVDLRTKIAHGETGIVPTPIDVSNMILLVKLFCRSSDDIVSNWFKSHRCIIRRQP